LTVHNRQPSRGGRRRWAGWDRRSARHLGDHPGARVLERHRPWRRQAVRWL